MHYSGQPFLDCIMVERWLILQWDGRWGIPDHWHGGIWAGPYTSKAEAEKAIVNYAGKESDFCDSKEEAAKEYLAVFF